MESSNPELMPVHTVRTLLRVIASQGHDVEHAIEQSGLGFNPLRHPEHASQQTVPALVYSRLYKYVMDLFQDESFGLGLAGATPPGTFRMMSLFIINCPDLHQAILRSCEFFEFCNSFYRNNHENGKAQNSPLPIEILDNETAICRLFKFSRSPGHVSPHSDASILYMMHRFYCWLIDEEIPLDEIHVTAPEPDKQENYFRLFSAPVYFGKAENALLFPVSYLDKPIRQNEESLKGFLKSAPYGLIGGSLQSNNQTISDQISSLVGRDFNSKFPNAAQIAQELKISPRTLHRKLQHEGTSYQELKDTIRKNTAINYLQRRDLPISAVATLMGFKDTSAFYRSFKKWTGISPGQYRKQLLGENKNG